MEDGRSKITVKNRRIIRPPNRQNPISSPRDTTPIYVSGVAENRGRIYRSVYDRSRLPSTITKEKEERKETNEVIETQEDRNVSNSHEVSHEISRENTENQEILRDSSVSRELDESLETLEFPIPVVSSINLEYEETSQQQSTSEILDKVSEVLTKELKIKEEEEIKANEDVDVNEMNEGNEINEINKDDEDGEEIILPETYDSVVSDISPSSNSPRELRNNKDSRQSSRNPSNHSSRQPSRNSSTPKSRQPSNHSSRQPSRNSSTPKSRQPSNYSSRRQSREPSNSSTPKSRQPSNHSSRRQSREPSNFSTPKSRQPSNSSSPIFVRRHSREPSNFFTPISSSHSSRQHSRESSNSSTPKSRQHSNISSRQHSNISSRQHSRETSTHSSSLLQSFPIVSSGILALASAQNSKNSSLHVSPYANSTSYSPSNQKSFHVRDSPVASARKIISPAQNYSWYQRPSFSRPRNSVSLNGTPLHKIDERRKKILKLEQDPYYHIYDYQYDTQQFSPYSPQQEIVEQQEKSRFAHLTPRQREKLFVEYKINYNAIRDAWKELSMPEFNDNEDLDTIHARYEHYVRYITIYDKISRWKQFLIMFWLGIEILCVKGLGLNASGLTQCQKKALDRRYHLLLIKLGERSYESEGESWTPEATIIITTLINTVVLIGFNILTSNLLPPHERESLSVYITDLISGTSSGPSITYNENGIPIANVEKETTNGLSGILGLVTDLFSTKPGSQLNQTGQGTQATQGTKMNPEKFMASNVVYDG